MRPTVFIPERISEEGVKLLEPHCRVVAPWREGETPGESRLRELLTEADAAIVRLFEIREADLARCPRLRVIAKNGVGMDNIDCEAATRRNVAVTFTGTASSNAVAEHAIGLMLMLARHTHLASSAVRAGEFAQRDRYRGIELAGRTLGILGLGRIGSRVARNAALGLGMQVVGYDPPLGRANYSGPAKFVDTLEEVFGASDFVSLHVPLTGETRHMIGERTLALMPPRCRLINTSRGGVIDDAALIAAIEQGRLAAAALDVFDQEPVPADHPLCRAPGLLLTPHIAAATDESIDGCARASARSVLAVLSGRRPEFLWNAEVEIAWQDE